MYILRAGLFAHKDDGLATLGKLYGFVWVKYHFADSCTWRRGQPRRDHIPCGPRLNRRMQQLVQCHWVNPHDGLILGNQAFCNHINRDFERCFCRALAVAGL